MTIETRLVAGSRLEQRKKLEHHTTILQNTRHAGSVPGQAISWVKLLGELHREHRALISLVPDGAQSGSATSFGKQGLAVLHTVARGQRPEPQDFLTEDLMRYDRLPGLLVLCSLLPAGTVQGQTEGTRPDYRNPALPTVRRVEDLLSRMTLEEKVAQMLCIWNAKQQITDAQGRFDPARAPKWFRVGIGRIERPSDGHGARARGGVHQRDSAVGEGQHAPWHSRDLPRGGAARAAGARRRPASRRPSPWRAPGTRTWWSGPSPWSRGRCGPAARSRCSPRWWTWPATRAGGAIEETFGEDPYLVARMGLAAVRGFQGGGQTIPADRVIATLKHMAGHGQPESGTNVGPASLGERTLRDVFFYPFEVAVKQGHARSLMPSYNEIDGIPSHANRWMLRDVLRGEWGFDGTIVSDWQAISQLAGRHRVAADAADAARQALAATVDVELPGRRDV